MDEPCSALDPTSTGRVEETIAELRGEVTVVIVTHNMQQAHRVSDTCAFFLAAENEPGVVVEQGPTEKMFVDPGRSAHARLRRGSVRMSRLALVRVVPVTIAVVVARRCGHRSDAGCGGAAPADQRVGVDVRRARDAAVGGRRADQGLSVNYLPTGSPDGLTAFGNGLDRLRRHRGRVLGAQGGAGGIPATLGDTSTCPTSPARSRSCTTSRTRRDARSTTCILSTRTIARIFTGDITSWSDPAIAADNRGLVLPDQPITVVYRGGQSGTTALFYDFVANIAPDVFAPVGGAQPTADERAHHPARQHAELRAEDARVQRLRPDRAVHRRQIGQVVDRVRRVRVRGDLRRAGGVGAERHRATGCCPTRQNISAALESATLRPDLSQELSGVYASPNPVAYPISAYSYIVTQCARSGDRPTCKGQYSNPGVGETLAPWMRYIACDGQVNMARIGYSPLPPNLRRRSPTRSRRMQGVAPEELTPGTARTRGSADRSERVRGVHRIRSPT